MAELPNEDWYEQFAELWDEIETEWNKNGDRPRWLETFKARYFDEHKELKQVSLAQLQVMFKRLDDRAFGYTSQGSKGEESSQFNGIERDVNTWVYTITSSWLIPRLVLCDASADDIRAVISEYCTLVPRERVQLYEESKYRPALIIDPECLAWIHRVRPDVLYESQMHKNLKSYVLVGPFYAYGIKPKHTPFLLEAAGRKSAFEFVAFYEMVYHLQKMRVTLISGGRYDEVWQKLGFKIGPDEFGQDRFLKSERKKMRLFLQREWPTPEAFEQIKYLAEAMWPGILDESTTSNLQQARAAANEVFNAAMGRSSNNTTENKNRQGARSGSDSDSSYHPESGSDTDSDVQPTRKRASSKKKRAPKRASSKTRKTKKKQAPVATETKRQTRSTARQDVIVLDAPPVQSVLPPPPQREKRTLRRTGAGRPPQDRQDKVNAPAPKPGEHLRQLNDILGQTAIHLSDEVIYNNAYDTHKTMQRGAELVEHLPIMLSASEMLGTSPLRVSPSGAGLAFEHPVLGYGSPNYLGTPRSFGSLSPTLPVGVSSAPLVRHTYANPLALQLSPVRSPNSLDLDDAAQEELARASGPPDASSRPW
jgi:hypothetical protein